MDVWMEGQYSIKAAFQATQLTLKCLEPDPKSRLSMKDVFGDVPIGCLAVYVRDETEVKQFVIHVSYLNQPSFRELLSQTEEEFIFDHPTGALTIPCRDSFIDFISRLNV
ncbi:Small auxin-up RNA [Parasponia andersonii]|uniref:Small auxin-up RNA n=1 Tax=Parasponia andersonii TaxID=3476 RepID=A0A2P5D9R1_PARAD|nr:Small auxin-up RNA [Parasponia andersonii]